MAALSTVHPTLLDVTKRLDPDGKVATIVELLEEQNEIITDMVWVESNLPTGHRTTVRTGLPTPTWRKLYGGVQPTKSTTVQITDTIGTLEAYAEIDKSLADINGNTAQYRFTEDQSHLQGMNKEFAQTLIYGNEGTAPEEFTGFAPRFNSLTADNKDNIVNAGGSGSDNTSVWLVGWGANTVHGIYPKGSMAGWSMDDKGQVTVESIDGAGGRMEAYRTHYKWGCGLSVRDWRYVVRIANIDSSLLYVEANAKALVDNMVVAAERIHSLQGVRPVFYCSRFVRERLRVGILAKITNNLSFESVAGKRVMMFDEIPVRRTDAILHNEAAVS